MTQPSAVARTQVAGVRERRPWRREKTEDLTMASIQLYDLTGAEDERRFSPFCWRSKLALAHKGLAFDTVIWRFTDKEALSFSGQSRVPVMVHDGETVFDSWTIACFLEDRYGDRAPLFGSAQARATTRFIVHHKVKTTGFSRSALAAKIGFKEGVAAWTIDTGAIRSTRLNTTLCG